MIVTFPTEDKSQILVDVSGFQSSMKGVLAILLPDEIFFLNNPEKTLFKINLLALSGTLFSRRLNQTARSIQYKKNSPI